MEQIKAMSVEEKEEIATQAMNFFEKSRNELMKKIIVKEEFDAELMEDLKLGTLIPIYGKMINLMESIQELILISSEDYNTSEEATFTYEEIENLINIHNSILDGVLVLYKIYEPAPFKLTEKLDNNDKDKLLDLLIEIALKGDKRDEK